MARSRKEDTKTKAERLQTILRLVQEHPISRQEVLLEHLRNEGFEVTQATVSRDIKELRLVKELSESGKYVYTTGVRNNSEDANLSSNRIFRESVIGIDSAMNIVCIKCAVGMANAACAAIDKMHWAGVVGTVAGDDTIFVLCRNEKAAVAFTSNLEKILNVKNS